MPDKLKDTLTTWSLVVGISAGVLGFVQAYVLLPYRVDQSEKLVWQLQAEVVRNREAMIRVEERIKTIQVKLNIPVLAITE